MALLLKGFSEIFMTDTLVMGTIKKNWSLNVCACKASNCHASSYGSWKKTEKSGWAAKKRLGCIDRDTENGNMMGQLTQWLVKKP